MYKLVNKKINLNSNSYEYYIIIGLILLLIFIIYKLSKVPDVKIGIFEEDIYFRNRV